MSPDRAALPQPKECDSIRGEWEVEIAYVTVADQMDAGL